MKLLLGKISTFPDAGRTARQGGRVEKAARQPSAGATGAIIGVFCMVFAMVLQSAFAAADTRQLGEQGQGGGGGGVRKLVFYTAGPRPLAENIARQFTELTGIGIELFSASTGQILAKLEAERFRPRADVVLLASEAAMLGLKQGNRLRRVDAPEAAHCRADWNDADGFYYATGAAAVCVAFRESAPVETDLGTWRTLLLEGKGLVMPSPSRSGTAGDFLLAYEARHPESFWSDFLEARRRGLQIVGANSQAVTGVILGAYRAVYAAADYVICREIAKGEPLALGYPGGEAPFLTRPIAVLEGTRNMEAAAELVNFFLSDSAQREVAGEHLLPARKGVPLSEVRARFPVPQAFPFSPAAALEHSKDLQRRFQYEIERAVLKSGGGGNQDVP